MAEKDTGLTKYNSTADMQAAALKAGALDIQEIGGMYAKALRDIQRLAETTDNDAARLNALIRLSHLMKDYVQMYNASPTPPPNDSIETEATNPFEDSP